MRVRSVALRLGVQCCRVSAVDDNASSAAVATCLLHALMHCMGNTRWFVGQPAGPTFQCCQGMKRSLQLIGIDLTCQHQAVALLMQ